MTPPASSSPDEQFEKVEVHPRSTRGAVVSVRLQSDEAQAIAQRAEKAGLSVSDYSRRILQQSLVNSWRIMIWDGHAPLMVGAPPRTGGDYGHQSDPVTAARGF